MRACFSLAGPYFTSSSANSQPKRRGFEGEGGSSGSRCGVAVETASFTRGAEIAISPFQDSHSIAGVLSRMAPYQCKQNIIMKQMCLAQRLKVELRPRNVPLGASTSRFARGSFRSENATQHEPRETPSARTLGANNENHDSAILPELVSFGNRGTKRPPAIYFGCDRRRQNQLRIAG